MVTWGSTFLSTPQPLGKPACAEVVSVLVAAYVINWCHGNFMALRREIYGKT
jgi:hypothetical protein